MTEVTPVSDAERDAGAGASGAIGRIKRGLAANIGGMGVTLIIQLVSVPVFLAAWGKPTYGEWLLLSAVPTYVALSDLSFSSVAGNSMAMLVGAGRRADAATLGRHLWSIVSVMTAVAVLAAVAIAIIFGGAFGTRAAIPASEAQVVLVALFLQVAVGNQYGVLDAWYRAGGHYPLGTALREAGRLLEFGALMGSVLLGAQPGTAALAFLVASTAGFGVSWIVLRRAVPWSSLQVERPHLETFRQLLAPGMAYMAFPIGNAMALQGLTIVVGSSLGPSALVVFTTTRTLTRAPMLAVASISNAIRPELSRSVGGGRLDEARSLLRGATQAAAVISLCLVGFLGIFGQSIVELWTRGVVDPTRELLWILLVVVAVNSVWNTLSSVLFATNQHRRLAAVYLAGAALTMAVAIPLSAGLGLPGAALALLLLEVLMSIYVLPAALRAVHDRLRPFLRAVVDVNTAIRSARATLRLGT